MTGSDKEDINFDYDQNAPMDVQIHVRGEVYTDRPQQPTFLSGLVEDIPGKDYT